MIRAAVPLNPDPLIASGAPGGPMAWNDTACASGPYELKPPILDAFSMSAETRQDYLTQLTQLHLDMDESPVDAFQSDLARLLGPGPSWGSNDGPPLGLQAVRIAEQYLGVPYVWGGTSPQGFDCSGLVQYVYKQLGISIPRVAKDQAHAGQPVSRQDLQPGDLVYFVNTDGPGITHIGMYAGDDMFIEAPSTGEVVKVSCLDSPYYVEHYGGATRVA